MPYNILYFKNIKRGNLEHITKYWAIGIVAGLFAPLIGSFVLAKFPLWILFPALFILLSAAYLTRFVGHKNIHTPQKEVLTHIRGLRTLSIIDGSLHKTSLIVVMVFIAIHLTELNRQIFINRRACRNHRPTNGKNFRPVAETDGFIWPLSIISAG